MADLGKPTDRRPDNGMPYYCKTCGAGFAEYMACEEIGCELESRVTARRRARALNTPKDAE